MFRSLFWLLCFYDTHCTASRLKLHPTLYNIAYTHKIMSRLSRKLDCYCYNLLECKLQCIYMEFGWTCGVTSSDCGSWRCENHTTGAQIWTLWFQWRVRHIAISEWVDCVSKQDYCCYCWWWLCHCCWLHTNEYWLRDFVPNSVKALWDVSRKVFKIIIWIA